MSEVKNQIIQTFCLCHLEFVDMNRYNYCKPCPASRDEDLEFVHICDTYIINYN